jgi:hypothetical protein
VEAAETVSSPLGRISIAREAIAQIVARVTAEAYGVVGMSARGLSRLLPGDRARRAIEIGRGHAANLHALLGGDFKNHHQPLVATIGDANLSDAAGSQRFENRVHTINDHGSGNRVIG